MKRKINEFIKLYQSFTARKIHYATKFEGYDYKHYLIFTKSDEIAYAFETDEELLEFITDNIESLKSYSY